MSTQSNAMPESSLNSQVLAPAATAIHPFYWSLRRELWENRYIYIAPLATAAVSVVVFAGSMLHNHQKMQSLVGLDPIKHRDVLTNPYDAAAGMLMAMQIFVAIFYSLEALYAERRDRSILFWKSLPVSDVSTVLSKASVPIVIVPLVTSIISFATLGIMLLIHSAAYAASGQSVAALWKELAVLQVAIGLAYHLVTVHALWHAPFYGWFLLVSSWAKRTPLLWAFLPPLALYGIEKMLFNTTHFLNLLAYRLMGSPDAPSMDFPNSIGMHSGAWHFFLSAGLWNGLIFTAICLALAVRMRRYRGPS